MKQGAVKDDASTFGGGVETRLTALTLRKRTAGVKVPNLGPRTNN